VLARIEALLRRAPARSEKGEILEFGSLRVDFRGTQVARDGKSVYLSAREFQLLRYLIEHRGKTVSRDEILKEVWNYETTTFTRTVDVPHRQPAPKAGARREAPAMDPDRSRTGLSLLPMRPQGVRGGAPLSA